MNLIDQYLTGPQLLGEAIAGMTAEQLDATPVAGKMSTRQVICHVADFEPIYADRMKRVLAEDEPTLLGGDPDRFAAKLAYESRDVQEEIELIAVVRSQMGRILRTAEPEAFQRCGRHAADGLLSLQTLLERITQHIPHHVQFIREKRAALKI